LNARPIIDSTRGEGGEEKSLEKIKGESPTTKKTPKESRKDEPENSSPCRIKVGIEKKIKEKFSGSLRIRYRSQEKRLRPGKQK